MTFTQLLALTAQGGVRVCADSRQVQPGDCFVAVRGTQSDGHDYIPTALAQAAYVVAEQPSTTTGASSWPTVPSAGESAQAACGYQRRTITSVTGTNGKTTTSYLVRPVTPAGHPAG